MDDKTIMKGIRFEQTQRWGKQEGQTGTPIAIYVPVSFATGVRHIQIDDAVGTERVSEGEKLRQRYDIR